MGGWHDSHSQHRRRSERHPQPSHIANATVSRCFAVPGVKAETALIALDLDGVMMSSGSTCSSGKVSASHVLAAMGVDEKLASCALRASFGWSSTMQDVQAAVLSLQKLHERVTQTSEAA